MRRHFPYFSLALAAGLVAGGAHSYASDVEQCKLTSANEQQRYDTCERVQLGSSSSPRDRADLRRSRDRLFSAGHAEMS